MKWRNRFVAAGVAGAALVGGCLPSLAGAFAIRTQGTEGLGEAFAGAAAGGAGLSSMFWNPATMTDFAGLRTSSSYTYVLPYSSIAPAAGTSPTLIGLGGAFSTGDIAQDALIPASYISWQAGERAWVGMGLNSRFGLVTQTPYNWAGQIYGRTSKVFSINANPNVALKLTDWLSVGVGLQVEYFKTRLTTALSPVPGAPSAVLSGDDTALGFTLGATLTPWQGGEIGVGYRSQIKPSLAGDLATPLGATAIRADLALPDQINLGLRQKVAPGLTLLAGVEWAHWSLFRQFPVQSLSGATVTSLAFNYRDGWYVSGGAEYAWSDRLNLRAGLGFERSPVTNANRTVRLPDNDRLWTTLGLSHKWNDKVTLDLAYAHLFVRRGSINMTPGNPSYVGLPFVGNASAGENMLSVGFTHKL